MQRFLTVVWALHVPLLTAWAVMVFFVPGMWTQGFDHGVATSGAVVFTSALQFTVGPALGLAFASLYAAMRESPAARRRIARALAVAFVAFVVVDRAHPPDFALPGGGRELLERPLRERVLFAVVSVLAAVNLLAWLWPVRRPSERELSGFADTKPSSLWLRWTLQAVVLGAVGVVFAVEGGRTMAAGLQQVPAAIAAGAVPGSLAKLHFFGWGAAWAHRTGALWLGVATFALAGIPEVKIPEWRGFRAVHMVTMAIVALSTLTAFHASVWRPWVMLASVIPVAFFVANANVVKDPADTPAEEIGEAPDGWTFMDLVVGPLMAFRVFISRRRGTHGLGVAAKGHWAPQSPRPEGVPAHAWFFPDAPYEGPTECTVRFANVTFGDDAGMDVRGAALRIDPPGETRVDILMNTGSCGPIANLVDFATLVFSKFLPRAVVVSAVKKNRVGREGGIAGLRRAPDSYALLHYYGQSTRYWLSPDDTRWLVRYRFVPADIDAPESGLPTLDDDLRTWDRARRPDERRARDYLRQELKDRLTHMPVAMRLEAQFHLPVQGDGLAWYNGMFDWPLDTHPWRPLGTVHLTHALSDVEAETLAFDPSFLPPSLGVPAASGLRDPRSAADSERRIIARTARLRAWLYREFGMPRFGASVRGE